MPTFVDYAGMNTLVSSSIEGNTISSGKNASYTAESIDDVDKLVGINIHRNGPYGYSSWKQLRVSENPVTRHHIANSTMTFVTQPGPVRNVSLTGDLRVRDRNSVIQRFTEPAIAKKAFPLVWNVGRHIKDENGNIDFDTPEKFSIISSYANQGIGFANQKVNDLHNYDANEKASEYEAIYSLYANGGLNDESSPITYWEFLQYRETVYPHMKNQFQNENLERPTFESFFRHNRADRNKFYETSSFGWSPNLSYSDKLKQSTWPLDEHDSFLTREYAGNVSSIRFTTASEGGTFNKATYGRNGEGRLMSSLGPYEDNLSAWLVDLGSSNATLVQTAVAGIDNILSPGPLYMRRISLSSSTSVSNPSGMEIYGTGSELKQFQGGALWEAGANRQIKDLNGNYTSSPKEPFYDTYEHYIEEVRKKHKNYSVVPEFRMSTQIEDLIKNDGSVELDMFEVTGGVTGSEDSSKENFYEIYSNSDFMSQFEVINEDHREFANGKTISLRCKVVKKFLPYDGFYPAQRTVDLTKRFYDSFGDQISLFNANGVQLQDFNYGKQMVMTPLFAPGILFNTIKSGVAVDYPIITSSLNVTSGFGGEYTIFDDFDYRIPFEALIDPITHLASKPLTSNEPDPNGNLSASAFLDPAGDELYGLMANNFLAEVPEFFLPNDNFSSIVSKKQGEGILLEKDKVYGMRVYMRKTSDKARSMVYHENSSSLPYFPPQDIITTGSNKFRESFTMYSRPSAFGPPSLGYNTENSANDFFHFDSDTRIDQLGGGALESYVRDSRHGFNFPFTPPYYHGESWCDIWITGSGELLTIKQIQNQATSSLTRFDRSYILSEGITDSDLSLSRGPQSILNDRINKNAVQLTSSLNIFTTAQTIDQEDAGNINFVVDTSLDQDARWVIQTKFECPMLNFSHVSGSQHLTLPEYGSGSVPRGMWHQYGRIPEKNEGVFMGVKQIEENWQLKAMGRDLIMEDLGEKLGFSGKSTKLGQIRTSKVIYEAVVAIPFIEEQGKRRFFLLDQNKVDTFKAAKGPASNAYESLISGEPQDQIGRSVLRQLNTMKRYIFPPSFDFLNNDDIDPIAMYIFEFSHVLSQQDLADIWQNLPPEIGLEMEESEVAITHPLLKKEILGAGGESGNTLVDMPNKLKWMVFKVKQRASSNYYKKIAGRNPILNTNIGSSNSSVDEFGDTSNVQYNWPYDFFSLVELVKIDSEVEFGNFDEDQIKSYTTSIPDWQPQEASADKIQNILSDPTESVAETPSPSSTGLAAQGGSSNTLAGAQTPGGPQRRGLTITDAQRAATDMNFGGAGIVLESEQDEARYRDSAVAFMDNLKRSSFSSSVSTYSSEASGPSKANARREAIRISIQDHAEFLLVYNFVNPNGTIPEGVTNTRIEMRVAADFALTIPPEFSSLSGN